MLQLLRVVLPGKTLRYCQRVRLAVMWQPTPVNKRWTASGNIRMAGTRKMAPPLENGSRYALTKMTSWHDLISFESPRPYLLFSIRFHIVCITQITLSEKCRLSYGRVMQSFRRHYQVRDVKLKFDDGYQIVSISEQMSSNSPTVDWWRLLQQSSSGMATGKGTEIPHWFMW